MMIEEKTKLDYLLEYLNALTNIRNNDGSTVLWANNKAGEVCRQIDELLKGL